MNIALFLEMASQTDPDRTGLICGDRTYSYAALMHMAQAASKLITESGVSHVTLLDESSPASFAALFGAAIAGVPYVPLNYRLANADLAGLINRITPCLLIGDSPRAQQIVPNSSNHYLSREEFLHKITSGNPAPDCVTSQGGEDIAIQLFTSGTTGQPKAAILRHTNLVSYILGTVEFGAADPQDAALISVPPYHIAGIAAVLSSVYAMRRMVMLPAFTPENWLEAAQKARVTNAFVVPTMLSRIVDVMESKATSESPYDISTLRAIAYGGGKMPVALIRKALILMPNTGFTNAYGLTETSSTIALLGPEDHRKALSSDDPAVNARLSSVGKPLPTIELQIRDDNGTPVPPGQPGEIFVRGDQVSGEYKGRSALDAQGWFPTRDAGWLDAGGYLFLSGRSDDVIVRGGENISPGEIEDVLRTHPAIRDACAVAIPSHEWGESVGVVVVTHEGVHLEDAMIKALIKDRLRSSRVPEQIRYVPELPYNEMGKLLRRQVKTYF